MSEEDRRAFDKALSTWVKPEDITLCDGCERYCMRSNIRVQIGSMRKQILICPECDLPEKWSIKYSHSRCRRYYVYFDYETKERIVRWSHPNSESPLHVKHERGEIESASRKRKERCESE